MPSMLTLGQKCQKELIVFDVQQRILPGGQAPLNQDKSRWQEQYIRSTRAKYARTPIGVQFELHAWATRSQIRGLMGLQNTNRST